MHGKPHTLGYARPPDGPAAPRRRWWLVVVGLVVGAVGGFLIGGVCIDGWPGAFAHSACDFVFGAGVMAAIAGCLLLGFKRPFLGGLLLGSGFGLLVLAVITGLHSAMRS